MNITFVESGIKRSGILVKCKVCDKEFPTRKNKPRACCSPECGHKHARKRVTVNCSGCGIQFEKRPSQLDNSKSGLYFCNRECKDKSQRIGGIKEIMPSHYGLSGGKHLWQELFRADDVCCVGCGEARTFLLSIHHIDGDRDHNTEENLEIVCGNCHIMRHLKQIDGEWRHDTKFLTPRHLLQEVQKR